MALRPPESIGVGLATAGLVYGIHSQFTPSMADMQGLPSGNTDVDGSERKATWFSIAVVSGISLLAKDPTVFVIGSAATVGMALFTRQAVWTDPASAPLQAGPGQSSPASANELAAGPQMGDVTPVSLFPQSQFVSS